MNGFVDHVLFSAADSESTINAATDDAALPAALSPSPQSSAHDQQPPERPSASAPVASAASCEFCLPTGVTQSSPDTVWNQLSLVGLRSPRCAGVVSDRDGSVEQDSLRMSSARVSY